MLSLPQHEMHSLPAPRVHGPRWLIKYEHARPPDQAAAQQYLLLFSNAQGLQLAAAQAIEGKLLEIAIDLLLEVLLALQSAKKQQVFPGR